MTRRDWTKITEHAARVVGRYDTPVTLRQLFYQLVSDGTLANSDLSYKGLSRVTAQARRDGWFPALVDRKRGIEQALSYRDAGEAIQSTVDIFRLDRTLNQEFYILLAVEKDGLVTQLWSWFADLGLPITALQGYSGQSHADEVQRRVRRDGRPAVLLYAGDFDPTGEDIDRDFVARTDCWDKVVRVALNADQVDRYNLPPMPGKKTDSRAKGFQDRHGRLVQVELDALDPRDLRSLLQDALTPFWDRSLYEEQLAIEAEQRTILAQFAEGWSA